MSTTELQPAAAPPRASPGHEAPPLPVLDRWPKANVALHWLSAALVIALLGVGFTMVGLAPDDPARPLLGRAHALSGVTLGLLTLTRLLVRRLGRSPEPLPLGPLHRRGVAVVHGLLYVALFAMAGSGLSTALGSPWHGYVNGEVARAPVLDGLPSRLGHGALAVGLVLLIAAHVGGVLLQQVRKGRTLRRMVPFLR